MSSFLREKFSNTKIPGGGERERERFDLKICHQENGDNSPLEVRLFRPFLFLDSTFKTERLKCGSLNL